MDRRAHRRPRSVALALLAAVGCARPATAPPDAAPTATDAGAVAPTDASSTDAPTDDAASCPAPPDDAPPTARCIVSVRGRVVDLAGAPLGGLEVTVCGPACYIGATDSTGAFEVSVGDTLDPAQYFVEAHGRPDYASLYVALPATVPTDGRIAMSSPLALPRYTDQGGAVPDGGGEVTAGAVTLTVPAGARLQPTFDDMLLGDVGTRLRTGAVPLEHAPAFAREAGLVAVWALAPQELTSSAPMGLRVANTARLAPGAAVDFVAMGTSVIDPPVNAGEPVRVAGGHVSADGSTVATDPGQGLSTVSWVGFRPLAGR